ncbi:MAG: hypothetical protein WCP16_26105 [Pseudanabaena sp. ELA645]
MQNMKLGSIGLVLGLATTVVMSQVQSANAIGLTAISSLSGGGIFNAVNSTDMTIGWRFTANSNVNVLSLGFFDATPANDLAQTHQVGIWDNSGSLLTSTTYRSLIFLMQMTFINLHFLALLLIINTNKGHYCFNLFVMHTRR